MADIKIQILSDLHLESPAAYDIFNINPKAPYLALLGDIGYVKDEGFFEFLRKQLELFKIVFLVLGNHEPYHGSWHESKYKVKRFKDEIEASPQNQALGKLVFLDKTRYDISSTVTILGCTLFSNVAQDQVESVSFGLNDFYHIQDWSVEAHQQAHSEDLAWLNTEVNRISRSEPERKIIILTHYCPLVNEKVVDPKHGQSRISSGFMTDLSAEQCWQSQNVSLWAFGHTHFNCDFQDSVTGKRVVSNQRGYYFAQSAGFDGDKLIELE